MEVKWYSGYKGEEKPSTITINGEEQQIKKVISEKLIEDSLTHKRKRLFVVQAEKGVYKLIYDGNNWRLL
ncbi:hypothetical protein KAW50_00025 [candidate division WOR-3 bacterium]|nr:hypothetical protein [candidate division WOR-3 bacterium]